MKIRQILGSTYAIHSSADQFELRQNLFVLFGCSDIDNIIRNLTQQKLKLLDPSSGVYVWDSHRELFDTLNSFLPYVLLRDYSAKIDHFDCDNDIDILINSSDLDKVRYILNSVKFEQDDVVGTYMHYVNISGQLQQIHVHTSTYIPPLWISNIIERRQLSESNLYIPNTFDAFFLLLFQMVYWKNYVKDKYFLLLDELSRELWPESVFNFDQAYLTLKNFMSANSYFPQNPYFLRQDPESYLGDIVKRLSSFGITDIKPFRVDIWKAGAGANLFTGIYDSGQVFIKAFGDGDSLRREYLMLEYINNNLEGITANPLFYSCRFGDVPFLITNYIKGETLSKERWSEFNENQQERVLEQLVSIVKKFASLGVIHRDLFPSNILITSDVRVYILDYEFAVDTTGRINKEWGENTNLLALYELGAPYTTKKFSWNDADMLINLFNYFDESVMSKFPYAFSELEKLRTNQNLIYTVNPYHHKFYKQRIKLFLSKFIKKVKPTVNRVKQKIYS